MRARRLTQSSVVLVIAALIGVAVWPEPIPVQTATVSRGAMRVTVDEDGVTRVRHRFVVAAPVTGRLERIEWEPGDPVRRGTILARLRPPDAPLADQRVRAEWQAALAAAEAAHQQALAERTRARANRDRLRQILEQQIGLEAAGAVAHDSVDAARAAAAVAEGAVEAAEAAVDRAAHEAELARARLRTPPTPGQVVQVTAPSDGVVLRRLRESETVVAAGEPLIELGDSRSLEIVTDLLTSDAVKVATGMPVAVEEWGGEDVLAGRVTRIEPAGFMKVSALGIEEQRVNVVIELLGEQGHLGDGYRATVRIETWAAPDVVKTPMGSVFRRGAEWAAFVAEDGRARLRIIRLGHRNDREAEVIEGLRAGDAVILHPPDDLTDGARVSSRPS